MRVFISLLFLCFISLSLSAQKGIKVLSNVDESPRFPSCEDLGDQKMKAMCAEKKMYEFIYQRLDYPESAQKKKIQGTALIQLKIGANGRIGDFKVLQESHPEFGEAAIEAIEHMPDWVPARQNSKVVESLLSIPIKFEL